MTSQAGLLVVYVGIFYNRLVGSSNWKGFFIGQNRNLCGRYRLYVCEINHVRFMNTNNICIHQ